MPQMSLEGKRILVVEDNYELARDLRLEFEGRGAMVLGPAPTPYYASSLLSRRAPDGAVLDIRLHGTEVYELAETLTSMGTPILFATGVDAEQIVPRYRDGAILFKPYAVADAADRLGALLAKKDEPAFVAPTPRLSNDTIEAQLMRAAARALQPLRQTDHG